MYDDNPIFRSFAMIEEKIHEKLTIENLADSLHISKYHYQRIFREAAGDSVMRYVTRRRLSKAAEELAEKTDMTILEIALRYGYDSHEGFTRSFRAYMGVTPTEYRKYHSFVSPPATQKERCAMLYSKTTDEMLRELNALIVQAKETADRTGKSKATEYGAGYAQYWENIVDKTNAMAEKLGAALGQITAIAQQPDEISARFMIIKAIEDAAFWSHIIAFETGLTVSRAQPEHRAAMMPVCEQYDKLAQNAEMKAGKIAHFFNELSELIFQDMRKSAEEQMEKIVEKGRAAVKVLTADPDAPYGYIADEITAVTDGLAAIPLEEITVQALEDSVFRLDIISFAADVDTLRMPSHKELFDGMLTLKEQISEAMEFFQNLSGDLAHTESQTCSRSACKRYRDVGYQGNILMFYLKGEIQKLGRAHLSEGQQAAFGEICGKLSQAIQLAYHASEDTDAVQIREKFQSVYDDIVLQVKDLGGCAEPVGYIAKELKQLATL